ncbi:uncharacterized protein LOC132286738 [Cornus florida]|uniref:uncharacterized protein LOC132286738 n=1 Tax=Cornus florida TaxID=4283 RepID=UPI00289D893A|nr:uncharacterized protein LOC132286738 [Cornus florida]
MEFKVAAKEDGTSSSSFIDQALSAGLLNNPPSVRRMSDIVSTPFDVNEALIMREIEKRRIREEIVMSELRRRRELEAEVMRELMLEREIAMRRSRELSLIDSPVSLLSSGSSLLSQFFNQQDGLGIEGNLAFLGHPESGFKDMLSLMKHSEGGVFGRPETGYKDMSLVKHPNREVGGVHGELPVQRQPGALEVKPAIDLSKGKTISRQPGVKDGLGVKPVIDLRKTISRQPEVKNELEVKPVIDLSKGKKNSVKPMNSSVAGIKRKFEIGFATGDDESPSAGLSKKIQEDWSCPVCQVKAPCEEGLKDHLRGKKHKAKERALRGSTMALGKSIRNCDPLPEKTEKYIEDAMCTVSMNPYISNCPKEEEEVSEDDMEKVQQTEDLWKINKGYPIDETTAMLKSANFKFWCNLCSFGTTNEASMTAHRMGENHMSLLQENGGCVIAIKNMPDNIQHIDKSKDTSAKEGKDETFDSTDSDLDGESSDEEEKEKENGGELAVICPSIED